MQVETINALISTFGSISASAIAAVAVLFAAKRVACRKRLRTDLIHALNDVRFLLEVENAHVGVNITQNGKENKSMIRSVVRKETGDELSGKYTISRINRKLMYLETLHD